MTDEFILHAIQDAAAGPYPGDDYDFLIEVDGVHHKILRDRSMPTPDGGYRHGWIWAQREGKPWQAAIEEVVRRANEAECYAVGI